MKCTLSSLLLAVFLLISCSKDQGQAINSGLTDISNLSDYNDRISNGVSLFFFHATWCPICTAQRPAIEALVGDSELNDVFFGQVDYEKITDVTKAAKVVGFPTTVFYKDGVEAARFSGQGHSKEKIKNQLMNLLQ